MILPFLTTCNHHSIPNHPLPKTLLLGITFTPLIPPANSSRRDDICLRNSLSWPPVLWSWRLDVVMAAPLYRFYETARVYACDCSIEALERSKQNVCASHVEGIESRFHPFYCDFSVTPFPQWLACNYCKQFLLQCRHIPDVCCDTPTDSNVFLKDGQCCIGGVDVVTLIFTLSAVPFDRMPAAMSECFSVLKPGGLLLFRDYGLYDMTMLRFEPDQKVGNREYKRTEGTRAYFFSLDCVKNLFKGVGFVELELDYCCIKSVNRRNGKTMRRVWVHGKFQKPVQDQSMK
nr:PREDICTED: methyltransferase-like protein 6 isoform X2 [Daucus carota subsp. sativus]